MFGFVNQFLAGLRGERVGKSLLVLRIACLDVVILAWASGKAERVMVLRKSFCSSVNWL